MHFLFTKFEFFAKFEISRLRLVARTLGSQSSNTGSSPVGGAKAGIFNYGKRLALNPLAKSC